ncbi:unnamed protein product [Durusdinium trenchii]|uniref:Uncharacterized protein n=2 Tax=Durusdinium trenchii TaxID=1381693 RepID=A0ABP0H5X9_9DINO
MPRDEQLPWDHVPAQLSASEATELILQHIEKGQVFARNVVSKADKEDLRRFEEKALKRFVQAQSVLKRQQSAPEVRQARTSFSTSTSLSRTNFQRGFGVSKRPPIYVGANNHLGPGQYDTHMVGAMNWEKDAELSHPAQKQLTSHKSPPIVSFTHAKGIGLSQAKITGAPGPGHYTMPDLWDPHWQHCPALGTSFARIPPEPSDSRFGGLAKGILKT